MPPWRKGLRARIRRKVMEHKLKGKKFWKECKFREVEKIVLPGSQHLSNRLKKWTSRVVPTQHGIPWSPTHSSDEDESSENHQPSFRYGEYGDLLPPPFPNFWTSLEMTPPQTLFFVFTFF